MFSVGVRSIVDVPVAARVCFWKFACAPVIDSQLKYFFMSIINKINVYTLERKLMPLFHGSPTFVEGRNKALLAYCTSITTVSTDTKMSKYRVSVLFVLVTEQVFLTAVGGLSVNIATIVLQSP